jgi:membrane protease subunit HflK
MEQVLKGTTKVIMDKSASGTGVTPYLPLPALKRPTTPATPAPASSLRLNAR